MPRTPSRAAKQQRDHSREYLRPAQRYSIYMRSLPRLLLLFAVAGFCIFARRAALAEESYGDVSTALNTTSLQPGQQAVIAIVFDVKDGYYAQSHTPTDEKNGIAFNVKLE